MKLITNMIRPYGNDITLVDSQGNTTLYRLTLIKGAGIVFRIRVERWEDTKWNNDFVIDLTSQEIINEVLFKDHNINILDWRQ